MKLLTGPDGLMKICPDCKEIAIGRMRIHKTFGLDGSRADGFRVYCKGCRKLRRAMGMGR